MTLSFSSDLILFQDFKAVDFGHLEVEEDEDRIVGGAPGVDAAAVEVIERFATMSRGGDFVGQVVALQGVHDQLDVVEVVFDEQDRFEVGGHVNWVPFLGW